MKFWALQSETDIVIPTLPKGGYRFGRFDCKPFRGQELIKGKRNCRANQCFSGVYTLNYGHPIFEDGVRLIEKH